MLKRLKIVAKGYNILNFEKKKASAKLNEDGKSKEFGHTIGMQF